MAEKRFVGNFQDTMLVSIKDKENNCNVNILQIIEIANNLSNENKQLKHEKEELLDKILECQKALSRKRTKEEPHWHKYRNNEGYIAKVDLDIRF